MAQSLTTQNPFAPMAYNDLGSQQPGFYDRDCGYVYNVTLSAGQALQQQPVTIDTDSDFVLRCVAAQYTGPFAFRLIDASGSYLSDNYIGSFVFNGNSGLSAPWTVWPDMFFPAGSQIKIDITDQSGANNPIQIVFRGVKRYTQTS